MHIGGRLIPEWSLSGVLPPFVGSDPTSAVAPYWTTTEEIGRRFAHSPQRQIIFQGLLRYRRALLGIGIRDGFQWLNGSFIEDVERMLNRSPRDLDLVTFGRLPVDPKDAAARTSFVNSHLDLFDTQRTKNQYLCDAYFVDLDLPARRLVDSSKYWSGLFSHRRASYLWKGMLALDLASDDSAAWGMVT